MLILGLIKTQSVRVRERVVMEILHMRWRHYRLILRVMTFQDSLLASYNEEGIACKKTEIYSEGSQFRS